MKEKENQTACSRCSLAFVCDNNKNCFCSAIQLNDFALTYIQSNFTGCLCKKCLNTINNQAKGSKQTSLTFLFILFTLLGFGQFHSAAGTLNTSAMHKDSTAFVSWASQCIVNRGWQNISNTLTGVTDVGADENGTLKAGENTVVSLGDGGQAILTFSNTIKNGPGNDFAVFENSFSDTFLELAFVEVSSDGINYFRFPATCNLSHTLQIGAFDQTSDPTKLNNLAGKYRVNYGTPFDLEELKNNSGLDVNAITHIKIIDAIGTINPLYASYDMNNAPINDPYPTEFGNGGFDLDAVGVIHQNPVSVFEIENTLVLSILPNPCNDKIVLRTNLKENYLITLCDMKGNNIYKNLVTDASHVVPVTHIPEGVYVVTISTSSAIFNKKLIIAR